MSTTVFFNTTLDYAQDSGEGSHVDAFAYDASGNIWNGSAYVAIVDASVAAYRLTTTRISSRLFRCAALPDDFYHAEMRVRNNTALSDSTAVAAAGNKRNFTLAATGLDAIDASAPAGVAATFPQMIVQLWRRFFKRSTLTATQLKTFADDDTTVTTTQAVFDDGTAQTQEAAT